MKRVQIILDDDGAPIGAVTTESWDEGFGIHWPLDVGPFDTADEVWRACYERLHIQQRLF